MRKSVHNKRKMNLHKTKRVNWQRFEMCYKRLKCFSDEKVADFASILVQAIAQNIDKREQFQ